jgi:hypothetical protein
MWWELNFNKMKPNMPLDLDTGTKDTENWPTYPLDWLHRRRKKHPACSSSVNIEKNNLQRVLYMIL